MLPTKFSLSLPDWVTGYLESRPTEYAGPKLRMALVIDLAGENVARGTGGPFGAAVFERDSGRLVSVGVNLVAPACNSTAHAEMVAVALAQARLGVFDLGAEGLPAHELVTSCEPCAMCFGAIPWSGVRRVVCGARGEDAERIGFDEGPKPKEWAAKLKGRGIEVVTDVLRREAQGVFDRYAESGGAIYNGRNAPE